MHSKQLVNTFMPRCPMISHFVWSCSTAPIRMCGGHGPSASVEWSSIAILTT